MQAPDESFPLSSEAIVSSPVLTPRVLPSEAWIRMPAQVTTKDLMMLAIVEVLFVLSFPNPIPGGGATLLYLLIGFFFFLIPSAIAAAKLARLLPGEGALYPWIYRALGSFWDVVLGLFCYWLPPLVLLCATSQSIVRLVQALLSSLGLTWFTNGWQVALIVVPAFLVVWLMGHVALRTSLRIVKYTLYSYLAVILTMGLVSVFWLASGSHPIDFDPAPFDPSTGALFPAIMLGLIGIQLPLNLGGELREKRAASRYLVPSVAVIVFGYLIVWFSVTVVYSGVGESAISTTSFGGSIGLLFSLVIGGPLGTVLSLLATVILGVYLIVSNGATSLMQNRLLVMAAYDRRLPSIFKRMHQGIPRLANGIQCLFIALLALSIGVLIPSFSQNPDSATIVLVLVLAAAFVLWLLSAFGLFISAIILVVKHGPEAERAGGPPNLLVVFGSFFGLLASMASLVVVVQFPWVPFLPVGTWVFWIALLVAAPLAIGVSVAFFAPEPEDVWALAERQHAIHKQQAG